MQKRRNLCSLINQASSSRDWTRGVPISYKHAVPHPSFCPPVKSQQSGIKLHDYWVRAFVFCTKYGFAYRVPSSRSGLKKSYISSPLTVTERTIRFMFLVWKRLAYEKMPFGPLATSTWAVSVASFR